MHAALILIAALAQQPAGIPADAATDDWRFVASFDGGSDLDGDGVGDLVLGDAWADEAGPNSGAVWVLSGKSGSVLYRLSGELILGGFGARVVLLGDLDGDGKDDFATRSEPSWPGATPQEALVELRSGKDGRVLAPLEPQITPIGRASDVDGDGVRDIAALHDGRRVGVLSGKTRQPLFLYPSDSRGPGSKGAVVGDLDGDGAVDLARLVAGLPKDARVEIVSGRDGKELCTLRAPDTELWKRAPVQFGHWAVGVGDLDRDGKPDLAVACHSIQSMPAHVLLFGGPKGAALGELPDVPVWSLGERTVAGLGDVDGDGAPELVLAADDGTASVYAGRSRTLLRRDRMATAGGRGTLSVVAVGDVDADGAADYALGGKGALEVRSGKGGALLYRVDRAKLRAPAQK